LLLLLLLLLAAASGNVTAVAANSVAELAFMLRLLSLLLHV
jgi:hypothetical protein